MSSANGAVVFGVSHLDLPCRDLAAARRVYVDTLGFTEGAQGEGWLEVDAGGSVLLRLLQIAQSEYRSALRVQVADVPATVQALRGAGCTLVYDVAKTSERTWAGVLRDPDGHTLTVWRALTEDEYDEVPELPKQMQWDDEADALLKQLLKGVPALFRALARRKVVRTVEGLAAATRRVGREQVIRGYILASPKITRGRNRKPLLDAGVDVDRYQADWDAD
jgi:catechol 2,3-dioxygenase-like lactoylglutathione lyase family enzyme